MKKKKAEKWLRGVEKGQKRAKKPKSAPKVQIFDHAVYVRPLSVFTRATQRIAEPKKESCEETEENSTLKNFKAMLKCIGLLVLTTVIFVLLAIIIVIINREEN